MRLPELPYQVRPSRMENLTLQGINFSDNYKDGDLAECVNLSTDRYPYTTTRKARQKQAGYSGATALTAWEKLIAVQGTELLYDGNVVGTVTAGEKQFAVVNTKLIIWPDKKYLDMESQTVKDLGASQSVTGGTFTANTLTVSGVDLTASFKAGDTVTISGCTSQTDNNKDVTIRSLTATVLTVSENGFKAGTESGTLTLERKIPDLDYICESENRLWGCSNETRTIYASALGDPTNFFTYEGLSTDAYALAVGSEGDFTGCCKLSTSVLFWKETTLHKLLGSFPSEYSLYTYSMEGLQSGCHKSLQVINEVLFYMGLHGVYAFSGGTPSLISANFGNHDFTDAVAGNDGEKYFLSVKEGEARHLLMYDTELGLWLRQDGTECVDFARIGKDLYFLTDGGDVYLADSGAADPEIEWSAAYTPFYETMEGRKCVSKLHLRLELPKGSYLKADIRCDGKIWHEAGRIVGRTNDTVPLRIGINRCDKFELRLSGKGPCTILGMARQFSVGSDV